MYWYNRRPPPVWIGEDGHEYITRPDEYDMPVFYFGPHGGGKPPVKRFRTRNRHSHGEWRTEDVKGRPVRNFYKDGIMHTVYRVIERN